MNIKNAIRHCHRDVLLPCVISQGSYIDSLILIAYQIKFLHMLAGSLHRKAQLDTVTPSQISDLMVSELFIDLPHIKLNIRFYS